MRPPLDSLACLALPFIERRQPQPHQTAHGRQRLLRMRRLVHEALEGLHGDGAVAVLHGKNTEMNCGIMNVL